MAREVEGGRRGRKEWEGLGGKNGKPEPKTCPSSLENGKRRKGRTKGEWGAGAHLVARGTRGVQGGYREYNLQGGTRRVQCGSKGPKPISSPSQLVESKRFYVTLPVHVQF